MIKTIWILVFISSCYRDEENKYCDIISKADNIQIVYTSDTLIDTTVSFTPELVEIFKGVFKNQEEKCGSCPETGRLRFNYKNSVLLVVDFAIHEKDSKNGKDCEFLIMTEGYCYRLNYRAGMFLDFYMTNKK